MAPDPRFPVYQARRVQKNYALIASAPFLACVPVFFTFDKKIFMRRNAWNIGLRLNELRVQTSH
jgi:hypothetical protein